MKNITSVIIITLSTVVISCKKENSTIATPSEKSSKYDGFLSKFSEKQFDTLHVFSSDRDSIFEYSGKPLGKEEVGLFPYDVRQRTEGNDFFAVYKFPISKNILGLIARTPGEYWSSSVKLFFFDHEKDSITSYMELANIFGDAGDYQTIDSWLIKDKNKSVKNFMHVMDGHDNSVENENDTTSTESNDYYLMDFAKGLPDTISKNNTELSKRFARLLKSANP